MKLNNGDKAPDFTLRNTQLKEVSLSDYAGERIVILFFPFAFSPRCTTELCMLRDDALSYEKLNARIIAISVDSIFSLIKFKKEERFDFLILSDFNKEVSRSYGAIYEETVLGMRGVSKRAAFVVDELGTIRYAEVLENAEMLPNFEKIKETLDHLNLVINKI